MIDIEKIKLLLQGGKISQKDSIELKNKLENSIAGLIVSFGVLAVDSAEGLIDLSDVITKMESTLFSHRTFNKCDINTQLELFKMARLSYDSRLSFLKFIASKGDLNKIVEVVDNMSKRQDVLTHKDMDGNLKRDLNRDMLSAFEEALRECSDKLPDTIKGELKESLQEEGYKLNVVEE